jgi:hypothetical protein
MAAARPFATGAQHSKSHSRGRFILEIKRYTCYCPGWTTVDSILRLGPITFAPRDLGVRSCLRY